MRRRDFIILVSGGVAAGAMGLTIPATIIATAEEVIEQRGPNSGLPATKVSNAAQNWAW